MAITNRQRPDTLRLQARAASYPNRQAEDSAILAVDNALFQKCAEYERSILDMSRKAQEGHRQLLDEVVDAQEQVQDFRKRVESGELAPNAATAKQWERLRNRASHVQTKLAAAERESEYQAEKLADPWASWTNLLDRFQTLQPEFGDEE